jgi:hypothetical protein
MDINTSGASRRLGLNAECWMFARLPEAAKMRLRKMNASTISTFRAASLLGWETKSSCSNMRDRSGGRPIELVADPIVEGGGSDQFRRKLV